MAVDGPTHTQIRLILNHAGDLSRNAFDERMKAIYGSHAANKQLQSGATVRVTIRAMEEIASAFISSSVDQVALVAKDIEAFAMIHEAVESFLHFLAGHVEDVALKATGTRRNDGRYASAFQAAEARFIVSRRRLMRQLEIYRFTFTHPSRPAAAAPTQAHTSIKNRGGKPLAKHWDEMWATLAIMLFTGDLEPRSQADVERAIKDWFASRDLDVGDTAVRQRARQLWQKVQDAE